ncbi:MAG: phosphoribosylformylglycinamidine cyclo-ligase [Oscillospiraceae bacterium]|nr:phosphoribosylformylglycinamidine cyclo-ligase [Oscillospiraceae bacterium]
MDIKNRNENISYESAGVSIDTANETKRQFKDIVSSKSSGSCRPVNQVGAFASLVELDLENYTKPVFVLKSEEPGSKQALAIDNNKIEWIARDLINHLVNDIIVMGASPRAVLDTIICGKFEKETVLKLVGEISAACGENGCVLVGGETSEQPGMLPAGRYILQASVLGIAEKSKIIDGSRIKAGNALICLASNGLHTNGYSLVRKLIETKPGILEEKINGMSFLEAVLQPHVSYFEAIKTILEKYPDNICGMAHITGGGIRDNLERIIHDGSLSANIDLAEIKTPPIFGVIKNYANIPDEEMLATFNNGAGLIIAAEANLAENIINSVKSTGIDAYIIGEIIKSDNKNKKIIFNNKPVWN